MQPKKADNAMGTLAAAAGIERVLADHGPQLERRLRQQVPRELREYVEPLLENHTQSVRVVWLFRGLPAMLEDQYTYLEGPEIDIEALAEDYPCCEVGRQANQRPAIYVPIRYRR